MWSQHEIDELTCLFHFYAPFGFDLCLDLLGMNSLFPERIAPHSHNFYTEVAQCDHDHRVGQPLSVHVSGVFTVLVHR